MKQWDKELKRLKDEYILASQQRLKRMDHLLERLTHMSEDRECLKELSREFHSFSGSGTTYGFRKVSAIGMRGEQECFARMEKNTPAAAEELDRWKDYLKDLRQAFLKDSSPEYVYEPSPGKDEKRTNILIVDDDEGTCEMLKALLEREGFQASVAATREQAIRIIEQKTPGGMIVDVRLPDGKGYEVVEHLRGIPKGDSCAILMISGVSGFLDKVEAIHCGADGYFDKPVDWDAMIRRLDDLLGKTSEGPYRILYVEDDPSQAAFCAMVLESAGYEVRICEDPKYLETDLSSYDPHLLLMDILLPSASGVDLARFIRKDERFAAVPIIFLTTQKQTETRIDAIKAGGDDFLLKPVSPGLLLSCVAAKLERSRFLKSLIHKDGLTGLLTHSAFHDRARALYTKAVREPDLSLTLAMIDLDHFKFVNDHFGHLVGDKVLTSLGSFLRRRLRQSDVIGRYGGEEFSVIVEGLSEKDSIRLFSRLLLEFSEIQHLASHGEIFSVTFSAGIATLEAKRMTLDQWKEAADQALYAAKDAGRNRVLTCSNIRS